jgi:uncharacterized membrane protein
MMPTAPPSASTPPADTAAASAPGDGRLAYHDVIAPLLATGCGKCHGDTKQKGKLRVDSIGALSAGGKTGAGIVPGNSSQGTVLARLRLPVDDDKHMPPRDEPQLTSGQIAMLAFWIAQGATETLPASALPKGGTGLRPADKGARSETPATTVSTSAPASTAAAPPTTPAPAGGAPVATAALEVAPGQVALYRDVVAPLLARRCGECHSGKRSEGDMRVDDLAGLVAGKDLVPGKPADSPIVQRMSLPASNSDRMPPPEKPGVDAWEIAAVSAWVASGGKADSVVAASDLPAGVAKALNLPASPTVTPGSGAAEAAAGSAPPGAVVPLRASGCGSCEVGFRPAGVDLGAGVALVFALGMAARRRARRSSLSS